MKIRCRAQFQRRCAHQAFSISEALTGIAITGFTSVALIAGIIYSFSSIRMARENLRASQVLLEKMEVIRLLTWDQINSNGFIPPMFTAPIYPGTSSTNRERFAGTITIDRQVAGLGATNYTNEMRRITVDLSWASGRTLRSKQMSTYVSRKGMQNYVFN